MTYMQGRIFEHDTFVKTFKQNFESTVMNMLMTYKKWYNRNPIKNLENSDFQTSHL